MILGIDPGISGGWALLAADGTLTAGDLPTVASEIDAVTFTKLVRASLPMAAFVEDVHSMPGQGVASTFKFGRAHGTVLGVLAAIEVPIHMVAPTRWKKHYRLDADKEKARALALRMWPAANCFGRKKDHGRAEAALIARFGSEVIGGAR
ncbi:RuvC family protein [Xanthobacter flavus]|uniref:hypothetical protein n=1 Tax=Xanthobacter flavus TaxID=281 RepID=UPI00372C271A